MIYRARTRTGPSCPSRSAARKSLRARRSGAGEPSASVLAPPLWLDRANCARATWASLGNGPGDSRAAASWACWSHRAAAARVSASILPVEPSHLGRLLNPRRAIPRLLQTIVLAGGDHAIVTAAVAQQSRGRRLILQPEHPPCQVEFTRRFTHHRNRRGLSANLAPLAVGPLSCSMDATVPVLCSKTARPRALGTTGCARPHVLRLATQPSDGDSIKDPFGSRRRYQAPDLCVFLRLVPGIVTRPRRRRHLQHEIWCPPSSHTLYVMWRTLLLTPKSTCTSGRSRTLSLPRWLWGATSFRPWDWGFFSTWAADEIVANRNRPGMGGAFRGTGSSAIAPAGSILDFQRRPAMGNERGCACITTRRAVAGVALQVRYPTRL